MRKTNSLKAAVGSALCVAMLASCTAAPAETAEVSSSETAAETTEVVEMPVTETPQLEGYNLLWSDEFDGDTLNEEIWNRECREPGWTNNELQEYTASDDNIYVENGHLVLRAIREDRDGTPYYTSGKVNSQNNTDFQYGRVEVRARVPEGQGLWPAIWMMPQDESSSTAHGPDAARSTSWKFWVTTQRLLIPLFTTVSLMLSSRERSHLMRVLSHLTSMFT